MSATDIRPSGRIAAAWFLAASLAVCSAGAENRPQREDYTRSFQKSLTLTRGQSVRLEHRHGDIVVRTHPQNEVRVDASIRVSASSREDAAAFGDQIQIQVDQAATGASIRTVYPEMRNDSFFGLRRRNISFSVNYEVMMPESSPLA